MAYDQVAMRELGRLVGSHGQRPLEETLAEYRHRFVRALAAPPRYTAVVNVLHHGLGHVSDGLEAAERAFFLDRVERYRRGRLPLHGVTSILHAWAVRFDNAYLLGQTLFRPFPEPLVSLSDSGKGGAGR